MESVPSKDDVVDYPSRKPTISNTHTEPESPSYIYLNYFVKCNEHKRILNFEAIKEDTGKVKKIYS